MNSAENKPFYKIGEVCEMTGTQPYVLRFWESEFPGLAPEKNRSGQRVYRKRDIDLIRRIKTLLYEKEYTIAGARKVLETEENGEGDAFPEETSELEAGAGDPGVRREHGAALFEDRSTVVQEQQLPFRMRHGSDPQLEVEVKNLRARLSRIEGELRAILSDMDRRDEAK